MSAETRAAGALGDLRIIDLTDEVGLVAAKILTTLGAEVIRVEPPGGDVTRRRSPKLRAADGSEVSLYAAHYHVGKRSVTLDLESPADRRGLLDLLAEADVLLDGLTLADARRFGLDWESLRGHNPALVVTSITPFGRSGPWADYRGDDLIGYASGGMLYLTGEPDQPPVRMGAEQAYHFTGSQGVAGTLAALINRSVTGRGQHVDVSMQESVAAAYLDGGVTYYQVNDLIPRRNGTQHLFSVPFAALPCADGYFHWGSAEGHQWLGLVEWLGESLDVGGLTDPGLARVLERLPLKDFINALLAEFGATRTKAELFAEAQRRRLPCTPVQTVGDLLVCPHLRARAFLSEIEVPSLGRTVTDAGSPLRLGETPGWVAGHLPAPGEDNAEILDRPRPVRPPLPRVTRSLGRASGPRRALDGIRVMDLTWAVAGPMITWLLAAHGAEILKIESGTRLDMMRNIGPHIERAGAFISINAAKRSVTVDLGQPEGRDLLRRLVAVCDVVVDNFSPRVMPKLGLDYDTLRRIKPDLIQLSLPGFGASGPYRDYVSYGPNIMSVSGVTSLTGYPGSPPTGVTFGYGDYVGGFNGVLAILAAIHYRDRTGRGQRIEVAQYEAGVSFLGPAIVELAATGREPARQGNRHPDAAPHGVYPCAGEDRWCAIAALDDDQWQRLTKVLGEADLGDDPRFATLAGRRAHEDELDARIAGWTRHRPAEEVMAACQAGGVPAAVAVTVADLLEWDPHLAARGYYEVIGHPYLPGLRIDGATFKLSDTPGGYRGQGGPLIGEGNDSVFREILGLSANEMDRLTERGVINGHVAPPVPPANARAT